MIVRFWRPPCRFFFKSKIFRANKIKEKEIDLNKMATTNDELWSFIAEWYDPLPQTKKLYLLKYFPLQNQAEMFDLKNKKLFLKKSACPSELSKADFYIGSKVVLYSRDLTIVDYADTITRNKLSIQLEDSIILLPPSSSLYWGKIIDKLSDYTIVKLKTIVLDNNLLDTLSTIIPNLPSDFQQANEATLIIKLQKTNCLSDLSILLKDISYQYHISYIITNTMAEVENMTETLINRPLASSATYDHCTCCIIKPHSVKSKHIGNIIDHILTCGYEISAISSIYFTKLQAEEFLEVYKGVLPNTEYSDHILQLSSGISIALEIRAENIIPTFRVTAGPWDEEMAKSLRTNSIRGIYGIDSIKNAIHCTDLESDGVLECTYCFQVLG